ncbi:MAG: glycosyltransferase family 2 protein [Ruminococcus flavefaciens]|nr:glycosyltransferase family 2 protein [Ruminococcus flavefaciens]
MKLVSVVIPTHNRADMIHDAILSVLNQTYSNIEVLVVDDCSGDNTEYVIKELQDKRIIYIRHEENLGACAARNTGIKYARGEFIAFQDSDDIWESHKLETQITIMEKTNAPVSFCGMMQFDPCLPKNRYLPINLREGFVSHDKIMEFSLASTQCIVAKKECFYNVQFDENLPRLQDWDLLMRMSKYYSVYFIDKALVNVYIQQNSISRYPEKGIMAIDMLISKNQDYLLRHSAVEARWRAIKINYMISAGLNPDAEFKYIFKINPDLKIILKYILFLSGINIHRS